MSLLLLLRVSLCGGGGNLGPRVAPRREHGVGQQLDVVVIVLQRGLERIVALLLLVRVDRLVGVRVLGRLDRAERLERRHAYVAHVLRVLHELEHRLVRELGNVLEVVIPVIGLRALGVFQQLDLRYSISVLLFRANARFLNTISELAGQAQRVLLSLTTSSLISQ